MIIESKVIELFCMTGDLALLIISVPLKWDELNN